MYISRSAFLACMTLATVLACISHPTFSDDKVVTYIDPLCENHKDAEVIGSAVFDGKLTGFVWGDYLHAEFVDGKAKSLDLFIQTVDVSCFLALHKSEDLWVSYKTVCRYIPEGAGIYPTEEITQIRAGNVDFVSWRKKFDLAKNWDACKKLESKYTRELP